MQERFQRVFLADWRQLVGALGCMTGGGREGAVQCVREAARGFPTEKTHPYGLSASIYPSV